MSKCLFYSLSRLFWVLFLTILLEGNAAFSQTNSTISGIVITEESGETQIGAGIYIIELKKGTTTNENGFYSITIPNGQYHLLFRSAEFPVDTLLINLTTDTLINHGFIDKKHNLGEVEIKGDPNANVNSTKIGQMELDIELVKKLPAFLGEVDVIKTLQLLPGVSSVSEGGQGFYVRGGSPDQNLVLLDNATVYNASHLF